jgi:TolA-binding protein
MYVVPYYSPFSEKDSMRLNPRSIALVGLLFVAVSPALIGQNSRENAEFKLAVNLFNDGLFELAAEQFRQFIGTYPGTTQGIEARFYLGLSQMKLGKFDDARLTFQTFALTYQDNPKAPEAWWHVGEAYAALGNSRESALAYERVKVFHPSSSTAPGALVRSAEQFRLAGLSDDARRVLRIVLQEYSTSEAVHKARALLGELYFEEGNFVQARNELTRVIEGDPSPEARAQALLTLGDMFRAQWRVDQAETRYREITNTLKTSPAAPTALVHLGQMQLQEGRFADAAGNFAAALDAKKGVDTTVLMDARIGLGDAHAGLKEYAKAIRQYENVLKMPGKDRLEIDILWKLARVQTAGGQYSRAAETCSRILASEPSDLLRRKVIVMLAGNAERAGNYGEALRYYSMFTDTFLADKAAALVLLRAARISRQNMDDPRRAALYCEVVISRFPRTVSAAEAYLMAAACYEQLGDVGRSIQLRQEFVRQYPSADSVEVARKAIRNLETFQAKDKDAALEKLALLLGDVVAEVDRDALAFRLGETYFNDLKNYEAAAARFNQVINSGTTGREFEQSLFYRARAYEYLSWRDATYCGKAAEAYRTFLASYSDRPETDEAVRSLFLLNATGPVAALDALNELTGAHPRTKHRAEMLLTVGILQLDHDSTADALRTFSAVIGQHPQTAFGGEALYRSFGIFLAGSRLDSAVAAGSRYVRDFPGHSHSAEVLSKLGDLEMKRGNVSAAAEFFRSLVTDYPYAGSAESAEERLAVALAAGSNHEEALHIYSELLRDEQENPFAEDEAVNRMLIASAKELVALGRSKEARNQLVTVLDRTSSASMRSEALTQLGLLAKNENDIPLATDYFRQAGVSEPGPAGMEVADLMFDTGAYADAIAKYTALIKTNGPPEQVRHASSRIIVSRLRTDDLQKALSEITAFEKTYKEADADLALFELEKGTYFYRKEDYGKAMTSFNVVAKKYDETPSAPDARYWIGKTLESTGKPKEAEETFRDLLKEYPRAPITARTRFALGNLAYKAEKWDEATQHYRTVVEDPNVDPELLPFAMSNLIETYDAAGVYDAALDMTRRYLDRFPENEDSFDKKIKIGILYQRLGYNDQSITHLQGLLDQAGSDLEGEIRYYIAEANFAKGDFQQAILDFLKVPYLVTKKGKIDWTANSLYMAGQSYERLGKYDQAVAMYRQIIEKPGIDETFKAAAKKEVDRVNLVLKKGGK